MAEFSAYKEADKAASDIQYQINQREARKEARERNHFGNLTFFIFN